MNCQLHGLLQCVSAIPAMHDCGIAWGSDTRIKNEPPLRHRVACRIASPATAARRKVRHSWTVARLMAPADEGVEAVGLSVTTSRSSPRETTFGGCACSIGEGMAGGASAGSRTAAPWALPSVQVSTFRAATTVDHNERGSHEGDHTDRQPRKQAWRLRSGLHQLKRSRCCSARVAQRPSGRSRHNLRLEVGHEPAHEWASRAHLTRPRERRRPVRALCPAKGVSR
jgi:hypothetical protein